MLALLRCPPAPLLDLDPPPVAPAMWTWTVVAIKDREEACIDPGVQASRSGGGQTRWNTLAEPVGFPCPFFAHRWGILEVDANGFRSRLPHCLSTRVRHVMSRAFALSRLVLRSWLARVRCVRPERGADALALFVSSGLLDHEELPRRARLLYRPQWEDGAPVMSVCDWCGHPFQHAPQIRCSNCRMQIAMAKIANNLM